MLNACAVLASFLAIGTLLLWLDRRLRPRPPMPTRAD